MHRFHRVSFKKKFFIGSKFDSYQNNSGIIQFIGYESDSLYISKYQNLSFDSRIDATGCSILPGLVDSHTHPVWEGDRINEFKMKVNKKVLILTASKVIDKSHEFF